MMGVRKMFKKSHRCIFKYQ